MVGVSVLVGTKKVNNILTAKSLYGFFPLIFITHPPANRFLTD